MVADRVRRVLAEIERPLLLRHLVFGLFLVPVPLFRSGFAELGLFLIYMRMPFAVEVGIGLLFESILFSIPLILLFVVWSLPGARRPGLPKRSIAALCLLIAYHPFRYDPIGIFYGAKTQAEIARIHEQFPIVWAVKHLDTPLVLGLAALAILQHRTAGPDEKIWFHWLLFLGAADRPRAI
jgi:hypothetical protein